MRPYGKVLGATLALGLSGLEGRASAQLLTGSNVPFQRTLSTRAALESEAEAARFRLGPVRLLPVLSLRNVGYNDNVAGSPKEPVSDWTATVAGGARLLLPLGEKLVFRGAVLPEYTWYRDSQELRGGGGTYGGSVVALFNRMTLEAGGGWERRSEVVSTEALTTRPRRTTSARAEAEVDVLPKVSVFGGWEEAGTRYDDDAIVVGGAPTARNLDRDETAWRGGARYRAKEWLWVGAQVSGGTQRFVTAPEARDNDQTAWAGLVRFDRERLYVDLSAGRRKSKARFAGGPYVPFETTTYSFFASWFPAHAVELQGGGRRGPVPSLSIAENYFIETRNFAALNVSLGRRIVLRGFGSLGTNAYAEAIGAPAGRPKREDDVTEYGAGMTIRVSKAISLTPLVSRYETDSNYVGVDRKVDRVYLNLAVDFGLERK